MSALLAALRWDIALQSRNGFYWATAFVVVVLSALLLALPEAIRSNPAMWVPPIVAINLQITTTFFVAGLVLLERDEGTLQALAVSPLSPGWYLALRTLTLTLLGTIETLLIVWVVFGFDASWTPIVAGVAGFGVLYTGLGAALATRYESLNALLLPASVLVTLLLLPLLPHFGLAVRVPFLLHPAEPALTLLRAGYTAVDSQELAFAVVGSLAWGGVAFAWGRHSLTRLMSETRATGGR